MDKFFFLYNENERCMNTLDIVEESLRRIGQRDLNRIVIDPFDYNMVISTIMKIHHEESKKDSKTETYINFTSGTNIVAGACCSASYFIGATLYYIMDQREYPDAKKDEIVRVIKAPKIPNLSKMKPFAIETLQLICSRSEGIQLQDLADLKRASPQRINHHINIFIDSGLVEKEKKGRKVMVKPTSQGLMFSSWALEFSDII